MKAYSIAAFSAQHAKQSSLSSDKLLFIAAHI